MWIPFLTCALLLGGPAAEGFPSADWLLDGSPYRAEVHHDPDAGRLVLDNGLARRTFRTEPNLVCVGLDDLSSALRSRDRGRWPTDLTATAIQAYFMEGFTP